METILHNLSEVFAVSIIHSLWQCLLIYLALRIVLGSVIRFSSAAKYNISIIALYYTTLWFVYTLYQQAQHYTWLISNSSTFTAQPHLPLITTLKQLARANDRYEITIEHYLPYITLVYLLGLIFHSLKLTSAWMQLRQLKQSTVINKQLQEKVTKLSLKLKLKKQVLVGYASRIEIPCVAGYLKPLIMLPLSLTTYLSAKEIEAILLHELAHVKRNDYVVNLLQQVMSVIFFFNPFVYLINRIVNVERENSCDDVVLDLTDEPLVYAQALLKIEQNNVMQMPLALAATGKKYHLLNRIERIMKTKQPITNIRHLALAFTMLLASTVSIAWLNPAIGAGKLSVKIIKPLELFRNGADTTRKAAKPVRTYTTGKHTPAEHKEVWTSKNGDRFFFNNGVDDPKLTALSKEMDDYGKKIDAYYNSPDYKKLQENLENSGKQIDEYYKSPAYKKMQDDMEKSGKQMNDYYNSAAYKELSKRMEEVGKQMSAHYDNPRLKKLGAEQEKISKDYEAAYSDNGQMNRIGKQMEAMSNKMNAYFNSPEFKTLNTSLENKYGIPHNRNQYNSSEENFKKYEAELKQHTPAEVTEASEQMKKLGEEMRNYYNAPERKAKTSQMQAIGDSMRNAYNNPQIKQLQEEMKKLGEQMRNYNQNPDIEQQQADMRKLSEQMRNYNGNLQTKQQQENMRKFSEQMRAYANSPEIKDLQRKMKEKGEEMRAYTNTPEFKKKAAEWNKNMKFDWDKDIPAPPDVEAPAPPAVPVKP